MMRSVAMMDAKRNMMARVPRALGWAYWAVTAALLAGALVRVGWYTPREESMGVIQKIFYLHLPVAISTFLCCLLVFVASIGYLWQRRMWWDDLALAAAKVATLYCSIVLITGMIWGRTAWGRWWDWTPRLTFSLMLFLLYAVYLMVRASIDSSQRRAVVAAVYGVIAFLDVPLVYLSARLMPDIHPGSVELAPAMKATLGMWFGPVMMMAAGMVVMRYRVARRESLRRQERLERALAEEGKVEARGTRVGVVLGRGVIGRTVSE
jgi:heme exporter protein C